MTKKRKPNVSPKHYVSVALCVALALGASLRALPAAAAEKAPHTLDALMAEFAQISHAESRYVERRQISLLEIPLTYEGRLTYRAPDYLKKEVTSPRPESYEIARGRLVIEHDGQRRELGVDEFPPLHAFIESLRATLAGDLPALRRHYEVRFEARAKGWSLYLKPRTSEVQRYLKEVTLNGQGASISAVEIRENSGDVSRMSIKPLP